MAKNKHIGVLTSLGADAMDNMYDIAITPPTGVDALSKLNLDGAAVAKNMAIRANGFEPPKFTQTKYQVQYKTTKLDKPGTGITGDRAFSITFRLDANYNAYMLLNAMRGLTMDPSTGFATNELKESGDGTAVNLGKITVSALAKPVVMDSTLFTSEGVNDGNVEDVSDGKAVWKFEQCWITDLSEPNYKTGDGAIQEITATFAFGDFASPFTNKVL